MNEITTSHAPESIGPFSQAIESDGRIYVSGQEPIDSESGKIVGKTIRDQTARTIENVEAILNEAGASLDDIVKTTVFVMSMSDYDAINEVYGRYMSEPYPARSAVQVADLPVDIGVEIEAVARKPTEE